MKEISNLYRPTAILKKSIMSLVMGTSKHINAVARHGSIDQSNDL